MDGAIERTLRADVDLGCFLSGGIDSSLVSAFSRKGIGRDLKTFSVGFVDDPSCELTEARRISTVLGTQHTEVMVYPTDYLNLLGAVVDQFDEPYCDPSCIPTFKVSQSAKEFVDVVLTGDGLDELFGGYTRYLSSLDAYAANRDAINRGEWHLGIDYSRRVHPFHEKSIKQLFGSIPKSFGANLHSFYYQIDHNLGDPARSFMGADIRFYLPSVLSKVDRMTMAHSLEARSPFLCNELIAMSRKLDSNFLFRDGASKYILRRLFSELIDPKMAWLPKKGFANSSSNEKIVFFVQERLVSRLGDSKSFLSSVFGRDLGGVLNPILQSGSFYRMWSLLVLEEWISHIQSKNRMCIDYV
jgi:asparagine synthase (glutamine-hydrolysing)